MKGMKGIRKRTKTEIATYISFIIGLAIWAYAMFSFIDGTVSLPIFMLYMMLLLVIVFVGVQISFSVYQQNPIKRAIEAIDDLHTTDKNTKEVLDDIRYKLINLKEKPEIKSCPSCGREVENEEEIIFCPYCGTQLNE